MSLDPPPVLPDAEPFLFDAGPEAPATVLLCHGFTGTTSSMRPWGEYLHQHGLTVIGPRLPGHGTHWRDLGRTRWQEWYGELDRAMDTAVARGRPVFAMGLSMGGTLTIRLAELRGAELSGIVLVNPSLATERFDLKYLLPVVSRVRRSAPGIASDIAKPGVEETGYDRVPLAAVRSLSALWRVTRANLRQVTVPVRMYRSVVDHVVEPLSGRLLLHGIASTDVREEMLTDSFHVATLDHDAPKIFAGSLEFVRERLEAEQVTSAEGEERA